ncbi:uncharacterized protein LOC132903434 [Amyelois transitella]|uniref:uncharacterized protein LOC132903434 n=1 Tax=Amyelois transitella TaxID=680683 RepID=UPI00298F5108|nr:uncharacterized protein LOC132903434 [Amyelois transitella]
MNNEETNVYNEPPKSPPATVDATSEVGYLQARNNSTSLPGLDESLLRVLLESQNRNMMSLIDAIKPSASAQRISLPEFDPDKSDNDPRAWCDTVDLCVADRDLCGSALIIILSKALKGSASRWLSQVSYAGITWPEFKDIFKARYDCIETPAATLINLQNSRPKEGECYAAYASRLMTSLSSRWQGMSAEQIAISTILAHVSRFDDRLQRLAFTTEITSRDKLQRELQAFSHMKRKSNTVSSALDGPNDSKRMKPFLPNTFKCNYCGKPGHRAADCRQRRDVKRTTSGPSATPSTSTGREKQDLTCFKCGGKGHYASRCTQRATSGGGQGSSSNGASTNAASQRRVDVCFVSNPRGHLMNNGESFPFHYDSGAECSLIKECVASKFTGTRFDNVITLTGIGQSSIQSLVQILAEVTINAISIEILFHVVQDSFLRSNILFGMKILDQVTILLNWRLAVVNAIKHFRHYLQGRKFTVVTDCASVRASKSKTDLSSRVHRWWVYLQSFDFDIVHRAGSRMGHVDFLSRNPLPITNTSRKIVRKVRRVDLAAFSDNWLVAEQEKDEDISKIVSDLHNEEMSEDLRKTYELRKNVLHRKIQRNGRTRCLPMVPRSLCWSVINNIHESVMHLGADKTLEKAYEHYWFPGMSKYVRKFVDNCITCKISKSNSGRVPAELHPIPKGTIPWHTVHIDASGKLSGKNDVKEYVFVMIDAFTKYVLLIHSKNIDSTSSIRALKQGISLFGTPNRVISDQGRCFSSKEFSNFCSSHNINLHLIATGGCRANGQVERIMSTLKGMLTSVEVSKDRSWQDALGDIQLAINSTVNRVTKASPLELMIGKVARPLNLMTIDEEPIEVDLDMVREQATQGIKDNASYDKKRFDSNKAKVHKFSVGDFVLLENEERNQTKLDPKFKGPFKIIEVLDGDRYLLKSLNSNRTYKYPHDRVRRISDHQVPKELDNTDENDFVDDDDC